LIHAGYNNSKNISGIADKAKVTSINIFDKDGYTYTWQTINAYNYLLESGNVPDVLNCSFGGPDSRGGNTAEKSLLDQLVKKNCIVIAANGNDGALSTSAKNQMSYPAGYSTVISVGATDIKNKIADFSTKNSAMEVSAWGDEVPVLSNKNSKAVTSASGTSFAAPIVSGIVACLKQAKPDLNTASLRSLISGTSIDRGPSGRDASYGWGTISATNLMYKLIDYDITYDTNGGTIDESNYIRSYKSQNNPINLPTNVTRHGSYFKGWYMDPKLTKGPYTSIPAKTKGSLKLYAKWGTHTKITFSYRNLMPNSSIDPSINAKYGTLPAPKKTGYSFGGWFTDRANKTRISSTSLVDPFDKTLFAKWSPNPQKITFNIDGQLTAKTYYYDSKLTNTPKVTNKGYSLLGWYTKPSGGVKASIIHSDMTLYPRWNANKYKVKFDVNKGKKIKKKSKKVTFDKPIGKLPRAKRSGYKFRGWFTKKKGGNKITKTTKWNFAKNRTMYAHWKVKSK
jgi:uncharacterized repeat protein (TIGR02543 family)